MLGAVVQEWKMGLRPGDINAAWRLCGPPQFVTFGLWLCMLPVLMVVLGLMWGFWWAWTASFMALSVMLAVCLGFCLRLNLFDILILKNERLEIR